MFIENPLDSLTSAASPISIWPMIKNMRVIQGSITAPQGFSAAGVFCDIKRLGTGKGADKGKKSDLALIVSAVPAAAAGMLTTNQVCAAPVKVCLERVKGGVAQAIVANSGNANACTGPQGLKDAREMTALAAHELHLSAKRVLVSSTGRIGVPMPMENVRAGIRQAAALLGNTPKHAAQAAEAIMTSDTRPKQVAVEFKLGGKNVRLGGICKGAGMIQPGMSRDGKRPAATPPHATMLCFLTTDAAIEAGWLQICLEESVAASFNRITVDGDMSTNDTVLMLANGLAGNPLLKTDNTDDTPEILTDRLIFSSALDYVCLELAKMIVRDGEGASRMVTVRVYGAKSFDDANAAARAVANSALVKTSWHGGDPNWGRIIAALGYSAAGVIENMVDIGYSAPGRRNICWSLKRGQPTTIAFNSLCAAVAAKEFDIHINLNRGQAEAMICAADLTEAYVDFNKGDVGDPSSLGG
jgi:glutamate N-acetyltransferase/amino-acid N-acetyltransferase